MDKNTCLQFVRFSTMPNRLTAVFFAVPRTASISIILAVSLFALGACSKSEAPNEPVQQSAAVSKWEGQIIRRPGSSPEDGKVYLVRDGKKHWVVSAEWLKQHGYNFPADVKVVTADELAQIPEAGVIQ